MADSTHAEGDGETEGVSDCVVEIVGVIDSEGVVDCVVETDGVIDSEGVVDFDPLALSCGETETDGVVDREETTEGSGDCDKDIEGVGLDEMAVHPAIVDPAVHIGAPLSNISPSTPMLRTLSPRVMTHSAEIASTVTVPASVFIALGQSVFHAPLVSSPTLINLYGCRSRSSNTCCGPETLLSHPSMNSWNASKGNTFESRLELINALMLGQVSTAARPPGPLKRLESTSAGFVGDGILSQPRARYMFVVSTSIKMRSSTLGMFSSGTPASTNEIAGSDVMDVAGNAFIFKMCRSGIGEVDGDTEEGTVEEVSLDSRPNIRRRRRRWKGTGRG